MSCCSNLWGCYFGSRGRGLPDLVNVAVPMVEQVQLQTWPPISPRFGGQTQKSQCLVIEILKSAMSEAQSSFYHVLLVPNLISGGVCMYIYIYSNRLYVYYNIYIDYIYIYI